MNEQAKFTRLLTIIRLLSSAKKGITVAEIAHAVNISERTVFRYFKLFRQLGFTITNTNTLYSLKRNPTDISQIFDYMPTLKYTAQIPIQQQKLKEQKAPVWIYKGRGPTQFIVFDSLTALLKQFPVASTDAVYAKLRNHTIAIYPTCRIIRARFYKKKGRHKNCK